MDKYTIMRANDIYTLQRLVNEQQSDGYDPLGGVASYPDDVKRWFMQAMIKRSVTSVTSPEPQSVAKIDGGQAYLVNDNLVPARTT